jgi:hypothetical protein
MTRSADAMLTDAKRTAASRLIRWSRARGEYREMPGLRLTVSQACRLWQVDRLTCETVLERLVRKGFLYKTDGAYVAFDAPFGVSTSYLLALRRASDSRCRTFWNCWSRHDRCRGSSTPRRTLAIGVPGDRSSPCRVTQNATFRDRKVARSNPVARRSTQSTVSSPATPGESTPANAMSA